MWQKCPECVKIVKLHDERYWCPQCIKATKEHPVLFRTEAGYQLCFLHWLARNPSPVRSRKAG
jgi:hypothetical protein